MSKMRVKGVEVVKIETCNVPLDTGLVVHESCDIIVGTPIDVGNMTSLPICNVSCSSKNLKDGTSGPLLGALEGP